MNILFITDKNVDPIIGGIERITYVLANGFQNLYGYHCFSAFTQRVDNVKTIFKEELLLTKQHETAELNNFVKRNQIDVIIAQGAAQNVNAIIGEIRQAIVDVPSCKLLFVFHNMPGFEYVKVDPRVLLYRIFHGQQLGKNLKYLGMQMFAPLLKPILTSHLRNKYLPAYNACDKVILLTKGFIPRYARLAGVEQDDHFTAIGNAATFDKGFDMNQYDEIKQKEVLCVARFDERHKRVSLTLRIWDSIEKSGLFPDWKLRIVGYGEDQDYCFKLAQKLKLKQVSFEGKKDSYEYYRTASIFMMTSAFEGFPMVLLEAQQMGVVPMAFDTFDSVHDNLIHETNGFVIPEKDVEMYSEKLKVLMSDSKLRKEMAQQGMQTLEKFSVENITQQWVNLFQSMGLQN